MYGRFADDPAFADLPLPGLELRLDQDHRLAAGAEEVPVSRAGLAVLGLLVAALGISAVYARLGSRPGVRTHGRDARVVRVQVLNGSGEGGIGQRVASALRDGKLDADLV